MSELLEFKFRFVSLMNKCSIVKTRDKILQQTFGLLVRKGYNGVSVTDIQEQTNIARGLLYHYFGSQEQLFGAAIEKFLIDWIGWDKEERRKDIVSELIAFVVGKYQQISLELAGHCGTGVTITDVHLLFLEAARRQPVLADVYQKIHNNQFAIWKIALLNSFSRGELRAGINLESVTHHFMYIQDGVILNAASDCSCSDITDAMNKSLREFLEIIRR